MTKTLKRKLVPRNFLKQWAEQCSGITLLSGCFDVLHCGHVSLIENAYSLDSAVLVAINSDASIRRLKGDKRPVMHQTERAAMLAALAHVAGVTIFEEDDPSEVIRLTRPALVVKGGNYQIADLPERALVEECGGQVVIVNYRLGYSTTSLIERIKRDH